VGTAAQTYYIIADSYSFPTAGPFTLMVN